LGLSTPRPCPGLGLGSAGCSESTDGGAAETGGASGSAGTNGGSAGASGSGGARATGGSTGAAGSTGTPATGGRGGSGAGGRGGGPGSGGGNGAAGTTGSGGAGTATSCTFSQTAVTSTRIPTVGILTWSTTLAGVTAAQVDFGPTTAYGMTAPVNPAQPSYRTLLLGMKAARLYHYRITASAGASTCTSPDYTIMTGPLTNGLQKPTVTTTTASAVFGGFLITGQYLMNAGAAGAPAYILDADGDYVWWFNINSDVTGARMSYDGTHIWNQRRPTSPTARRTSIASPWTA